MFDIDTFLTTQNTSGGPVIRQLDRPVTYGSGVDDDADTEKMSAGAAIGQAIGLLIIAGTLLFYLAW